jgi:hypothetical protein
MQINSFLPEFPVESGTKINIQILEEFDELTAPGMRSADDNIDGSVHNYFLSVLFGCLSLVKH